MSPNPQFSVDLVTFTEKILTGKNHFFCSDLFFGPSAQGVRECNLNFSIPNTL